LVVASALVKIQDTMTQVTTTPFLKSKVAALAAAVAEMVAAEMVAAEMAVAEAEAEMEAAVAVAEMVAAEQLAAQ
jgi:hypothetical protein